MAESKQEKEPISRAQLWLWGALGLMAVAGVALIAIGDCLSNYAPGSAHVITEIGTALIVACVLGFTVDRFAKNELLRDAFYAAFRYVLPDELKEEVVRIINYKFLCKKHDMVVTIEPIDDEFVELTVKVERHYTNITRHPEPLKNHFMLDEFGHPTRRSSIDECSIERDDGKKEMATEYISEPDRPERIGKETKEIILPSRATATRVSIGKEIHRINGVFTIHFFAGPTVQPEVLIRAPETLVHRCTFGVPGERVIESEIDIKYTLDGNQFPGQHIWIRWWPVDTSGRVSGQ